MDRHSRMRTSFLLPAHQQRHPAAPLPAPHAAHARAARLDTGPATAPPRRRGENVYEELKLKGDAIREDAVDNDAGGGSDDGEFLEPTTSPDRERPQTLPRVDSAGSLEENDYLPPRYSEWMALQLRILNIFKV